MSPVNPANPADRNPANPSNSTPPVNPANASNSADADKSKLSQAVQAQFSRQAARYEQSPVHARGEDLAWAVEAANLTGVERVLDVGTGTGHTAFAMAPHCRSVMGLDLTARMIVSAASLADEKELANVQFVVSDGASMPFPDAYFDVVTTRLAAHHFADPDAVATEMARVLRPGGRLVFVDHVAPPNPSLDSFINRIDWLRDSSHVREWTVKEWIDRFAANGVDLAVHREYALPLDFRWWIEQAATPEDRVAELIQMFGSADEEATRTFHIQLDAEGLPVLFALQSVVLAGNKRG